MTRFLISLDQAVDTIFEAVQNAQRGETYIPRIPSAKVTDIAAVLIGKRPIKTVFTGIRPGEKIHEILVSEEECHRTEERGKYYVIRPILPEVQSVPTSAPVLNAEYSSADAVMNRADLTSILNQQNLMVEDDLTPNGELLQ